MLDTRREDDVVAFRRQHHVLDFTARADADEDFPPDQDDDGTRDFIADPRSRPHLAARMDSPFDLHVMAMPQAQFRRDELSDEPAALAVAVCVAGGVVRFHEDVELRCV